MKIYKNNEVIDEKVKIAETFWQKLRGKFFIKGAVMLKNCNSIHTIFMRKTIDVVFLNSDNKVIKIYENLLPRCILFPVLNAKNVIEFDAGFIKSAKIKTGDILEIKE